MKILLVSTSLQFKDPVEGNLAGAHMAYGAGFRALGHEVTSISHRQAPSFMGDDYDVMILRDVTVSPEAIVRLANKSCQFGFWGHAEFIQSNTLNAPFFTRLKELGRLPDHIFYDQPLAKKRYDEIGVDIPGTFLGWGANMACKRLPWREKDIDILWIGHDYGERQPRVRNLIWPLKDSEYNVKIHGRGQPDGPLNIPDLLDAYSRAKIVVRISHKAHWGGGYSGRSLYEALASGCYAVHDTYPTCHQMFPCGVSFVPVEEVREKVLQLAGMSYGYFHEHIERAFGYVRNHHMTSHHAQRMLELLEAV